MIDLLDYAEEMVDQTKVARRLEAYFDEYSKTYLKFPKEGEQTAYAAGATEGITWVLLDQPVLLYSIGLNGPAMVELCSVFEWWAKVSVMRHLNLSGSTLKRIFDFESLPDLCDILKEKGILDDKDVLFTRKLSSLRNGVVHKNERTVSNAVLSGRKIGPTDIDSELRKMDILPYIMETTRIMTKMMGEIRPD